MSGISEFALFTRIRLVGRSRACFLRGFCAQICASALLTVDDCSALECLVLRFRSSYTGHRYRIPVIAGIHLQKENSICIFILYFDYSPKDTNSTYTTLHLDEQIVKIQFL